MRDHNQVDATQLPPADNDQVSSVDHVASHGVKKSAIAFFMEDWPSPPKCINEEGLDDDMKSDLRKWRLQTLLAVQPFGLPSLALGQAYEKMFGAPFVLQDFNCDKIMQLAEKMDDILVVQEPDKTTPLLHPEYPNDTIFHDARLGHDFLKPDLDGAESSASTLAPGNDYNDLIHRAWMDRDLDFPEDAALLGEYYDDVCKVALAMVPGSRGLYRARIVSAGDPHSIVIRLEATEETLARIEGLSAEICQYFKQTMHPIDAYNVPEQFFALDFPCLLYSSVDKAWIRCKVVSRSRSNHNLVYVECIDYGCVYAVNKIFLYLMPRKFLSIPRLSFEVKLAGVKPPDGSEKFPRNGGSRIRCFSIDNYYLDVLLIDMKKERKIFESANSEGLGSRAQTSEFEASQPTQSTKDVCSNDGNDDLDDGRLRFRNRAAYSAIIVDRNFEERDIYLDEILVTETYAGEDLMHAKELARIKSDLKDILEKVPRPKNPLGPIFPE